MVAAADDAPPAVWWNDQNSTMNTQATTSRCGKANSTSWLTLRDEPARAGGASIEPQRIQSCGRFLISAASAARAFA